MGKLDSGREPDVFRDVQRSQDQIDYLQQESVFGPAIVDTLPTNGLFEGRRVYLKSGNSRVHFIYSGDAWRYTDGGGPSGMIVATAAISVPYGWLVCDGSAVSRATYPDLWAALSASLGAGTVTIASPGVWTLNNHGMSDGDALYLTTTGALPTGLAVNTLYYVKSSATNTFRLAATRGGADINTSGTQSGVHTVIRAPYGIGNGTTTFTLPDLRGRSPLGPDGAAGRITGPSDVPGSTGGAESVKLTAAESGTNGNGSTTSSGSHTHNYNRGSALGGGPGSMMTGTSDFSDVTITGGTHSHPLAARDADNFHNNLQPYQIVTNWIIKV